MWIQGQLCHLTCEVGKRSLKPYQNEHNSTKVTGEEWEKPWKVDPNLVPLPNCTFFHLILQSLRLSQKLLLMKWSLVNAQEKEKKTDWEKCKKRGGEKAGEELKSRLLYHLSIRGQTHKKLASICLSTHTVHLNSLFYSHMVAMSLAAKCSYCDLYLSWVGNFFPIVLWYSYVRLWVGNSGK